MAKLGVLVRVQRATEADGTDTPDSNLGIGKLLRATPEEATVEYFCSVAQRIQQTVPLNTLRRVKLHPQTRCYIKFHAQDTWKIGRIAGWDEDEQQYQIDFPDGIIFSAPEQDIFVRCNLPIEDPIEILAMKGQETPYFHKQRSPLIRSFIGQRAVSSGMTGLISANIELYPHQVEVVRRVLEDPIQRYLLADEVGLGKTIEAGVILRQFLLDEKEGKALVLVPEYLVAQWQQELEEKFYISQFPDRVEVLAIDDWEELRRRTQDLGIPPSPLGAGCEEENGFFSPECVSPRTDTFDFLILDEAHQIAALARSSNSRQKQCFETCKLLAHRCARLLLLSATTVLNHEQDFLTMLHLLDPTTYKLEDLEGFRALVQNRQEIGRVLLSFKEGANPLVLKTQVKQLQTLFSEDLYLLNLTEELQTCLENPETSPKEKEHLVGRICTHISDTYRLHRRMLRNRRAAVQDVIFERNIVPKAEYDLDERCYELHELLEQWRTVAPSDDYQRIFLLFFRGSSTWLGILQQLVESRLNGFPCTTLTPDFSAEDVQLLTQTPLFPGEQEILQGILQLITKPSEDGDRLELLKLILLYHLSEILGLQSYQKDLDKLLVQVQQRVKYPFASDRFDKLVIFTSFTQTCGEIVQFLREIFGEEAVVSHHRKEDRITLEENLKQFKTAPHCFLLVCDSSGEEGRNLQFADGVIHFDLPWSPNRLEQRLGTVDRIGGKMQLKSWLLAGPDLPDSFPDAWYQLLKDGFGIFHQSIASLQFYVEAKLTNFEQILFEAGAAGLLEIINPVQEEIVSEIGKISEQNALDEIDAQEETAVRYFQTLENYDSRHKEMQKATEKWLCESLHFKDEPDVNISGVVKYQRSKSERKQTLVPLDDLKGRFGNALKISGTYNRRIANQHPGIHLYRIGEILIDTLASYMQWDDRGKAFALWRCEQNWDEVQASEWKGFRFDYVVELNFDIVEKILQDFPVEHYNIKALKRQADALFPPLVETVFMSSNLEIVEEQKLLKILQRPYLQKKELRDYNLAKERLSILDQFISPTHWPDFCRNARIESEKLLRDRPSFSELCQRRSRAAIEKLENQLNQLGLRLKQSGGNERISAEELELEKKINQALIEGIKHPKIIPDSVGFIIISGRTPEIV